MIALARGARVGAALEGPTRERRRWLRWFTGSKFSREVAFAPPERHACPVCGEQVSQQWVSGGVAHEHGPCAWVMIVPHESERLREATCEFCGGRTDLCPSDPFHRCFDCDRGTTARDRRVWNLGRWQVLVRVWLPDPWFIPTPTHALGQARDRAQGDDFRRRDLPRTPATSER